MDGVVVISSRVLQQYTVANAVPPVSPFCLANIIIMVMKLDTGLLPLIVLRIIDLKQFSF